MAEYRSVSELQEQLQKTRQLEKRFYLKAGLGFLAGLLLFVSVFKTTGIFATIAGTAALVIMVVSLILFSYFFDLFYRLKGMLRAEMEGEEFRETYVNWPNWYLKWGRTALICLLVLFMSFGTLHENDFGGNVFVRDSIIAGVIAGLASYHIGKLMFPEWSGNRNLSVEIGLYFLLGFVYLFVFFGPVANKYLARGKAECRHAEVISVGSKYLHVFVDGRKERFRPSHTVLESLEGKKMVQLCVRKGFLGYDYVHEFRAPD